MAVPAGRMRHPVTLQEQQQTQDPETGEIIVTWVGVATEWAAIEGINGREFLQSAATQAETTWRITMRYRELNPSWRIVADGVNYGIEAILPDNRVSQVTVMAKTLAE